MIVHTYTYMMRCTLKQSKPCLTPNSLSKVCHNAPDTLMMMLYSALSVCHLAANVHKPGLDIVPAVVAAAAFMVHAYFLGRPLSPSIGFSALTLFNLLRNPLAIFPEMINFLIRSRISLARVEAYLATADARGACLFAF
jgi:hypothetical protein